tara:strand:- start:187 stop:603 length:417 start_codon:yes stop_codon:yes gene_type:complete
MSSPYTGSNSTGSASRVVNYGYGLSDITSAREANKRQTALQRFNLNRQFDDLGSKQRGTMNQRGMIDSGVAKKASERLAGDKQLASWNLEGQAMEAQSQLDRQQALLENEFAGAGMDSAISEALRRFGIAQTIQSLAS